MRPMDARRNGFTLVELMVIITLMLILGAIAIPSMRTWSIQHQRGASASEVFTLLSQARAMAVSTSTQADVTVVPVATPPGGTLNIAIGAPVNWNRTLTLGTGRFNAMGIVAAVPAGPFTISPRGTVAPGGFVLTLQNQNNQQATVTVSPIGDITVALL